MEAEDEGEKRRVKMERNTMGAGKKMSDGLAVARAYRPQWSLLPEAVDELPDEPNLYL